MKRDDFFTSKYVKASDLKGEPRILKIEAVTSEMLKNPKNGEEQRKPVLHFVGVKKTMPLNMTNWDAVADICGEDSDTWPGHRIEVFPTTAQLGNQTVDAIRIRQPATKASASKSKAGKAEPGMDDEIPF
jgi:hypothetical protein